MHRGGGGGIAVATMSGPAGAATIPSIQVCNTTATPSNAVIDFHGTRYGARTVSAQSYSCSPFRSLPAGLPFTLTVSSAGQPDKVTQWTMPNNTSRLSVFGYPSAPQYALAQV